MLHNIIPIFKNEQKCDLVICLSHIGYDYKDEPNKISDKILAAKTENIDIILGGHTHTFLPEPQTFTNRAGQKCSGKPGWLGRSSVGQNRFLL
jgi:5'-nucleotidase